MLCKITVGNKKKVFLKELKKYFHYNGYLEQIKYNNIEEYYIVELSEATYGALSELSSLVGVAIEKVDEVPVGVKDVKMGVTYYARLDVFEKLSAWEVPASVKIQVNSVFKNGLEIKVEGTASDLNYIHKHLFRTNSAFKKDVSVGFYPVDDENVELFPIENELHFVASNNKEQLMHPSRIILFSTGLAAKEL